MQYNFGGNKEVATAENIAQALSKSASAHNSVYVNGCFSSKLLDEAMQLGGDLKDAVYKTDWFVTAAPLQSCAPEVLPAQVVSGTTRQKLFGKMLQRISFNGDGLGARALVDGKLVYPLRQSVLDLEKAIAKARPEEKEKLLSLHQELSLLQRLADAKDSKTMFQALNDLEAARPGTVSNMALWQIDDPLLNHRFFFDDREMPTSFYWGIEKEKFPGRLSNPYVRLKPQWVEYVSATAKKMFAQIPQKPKSLAPQASAPRFSSKAAEYVFSKRSPCDDGNRVSLAFFRIPVEVPAVEKAPWNKSIKPQQLPALQEKYTALMQDFKEIKGEINTALYYAKNQVTDMDWRQKMDLENRLTELRSNALTFQRDYLRGKPLQDIVDWTYASTEVLIPIQRGHFLPAPTFARADRTYKEAEFFLIGGKRNAKLVSSKREIPSKKRWQQAQQQRFPQGMRVAVLNDDAEVLEVYQKWLSQGWLGAEENWTFYRKMDDFLGVLDQGKKFDLVITDLNLVDGNTQYFVSWMRMNGHTNTPIIASSSFPDYMMNGSKLLSQGFDGYFSSQYLVKPYGEGNFLRVLNNYFKYKEKNNWIR